MTDKRYEELLEKYMTGSATVDEQLELQAWYDLKNQGDMIWQAEVSDEEVLVRNRILANIYSKRQSPKLKRNISWPKWVAAASIALAVTAGSYYYYQSKIKDSNSSTEYANDIAPGKNGATLILANGKKILINDALAGNIANESGVQISKDKNGQLIYTVSPTGGGAEGRGGFNTLSTTRGQQSQVRLPDGTLVFLNAESSLRYPTSFANSAKREVFLSGEGYFEVFKDKQHPFIVKNEKQQVEVLGTHFNIQGYPKSAEVKTTLIEGSVKVLSSTGISKILKPNQQLLLSAQGAEIKDIDAEYEIAWKEGFFMFNNESLESIMKKVASWYNVEVVYEDASQKNKTFIGAVSRFDNISKVLRMLEKTEKVAFKIDGGKVIVIRKNR